MSETPKRPAEFDDYADRYSELIRDPMRDAFSGGDRYFAERKLQVIDAFFRQHGADSRTLDWLDVGCGLGELLTLGRSQFKSVAGCDPSKEMLQAAGAAAADITVRVQESVAELPFEANRFDFVTAVCVYHHVELPDRPRLTREVLRVLKPGGVFAIIEHNPLNPATQLIVKRSPVDAHARLLTAGAARRLAQECGATVLRTSFFLYLPKSLHKHFGAVENALQHVPFGGQYAMFCGKH